MVRFPGGEEASRTRGPRPEAIGSSQDERHTGLEASSSGLLATCSGLVASGYGLMASGSVQVASGSRRGARGFVGGAKSFGRGGKGSVNTSGDKPASQRKIYLILTPCSLSINCLGTAIFC